MIVSVGELKARCEACGSTQFDPVAPAELRSDTELTCARCRRKTSYRDLLEKIGEQAMKQANESLAKLRGKKDG